MDRRSVQWKQSGSYLARKPAESQAESKLAVSLQAIQSTRWNQLRRYYSYGISFCSFCSAFSIPDSFLRPVTPSRFALRSPHLLASSIVINRLRRESFPYPRILFIVPRLYHVHPTAPVSAPPSLFGSACSATHNAPQDSRMQSEKAHGSGMNNRHY